MPRTIRTKLYRFSELSEAAQRKESKRLLARSSFHHPNETNRLGETKEQYLKRVVSGMEARGAEYLADGTFYTR